MGLLEVLFVILLGLKLGGLITIGWFFVFLPLIISFGIYMTFGILTVVASKKVHKEFKKW